MKNFVLMAMIFIVIRANAQINENTKPVANNLQTYQSLPMDDIIKLKNEAYKNALNQAKQEISNFLDYYYSIKSFKVLSFGDFPAKVIFNSELITDGKVIVNNNRVFEIDVAGGIFSDGNGLKINSEIINGHAKVFFEKNGTYTPIDIYIPFAFQ